MVTIAAVIRERRRGSFGMPREVTAMKLHPFLFIQMNCFFPYTIECVSWMIARFPILWNARTNNMEN